MLGRESDETRTRVETGQRKLAGGPARRLSAARPESDAPAHTRAPLRARARARAQREEVASLGTARAAVLDAVDGFLADSPRLPSDPVLVVDARGGAARVAAHARLPTLARLLAESALDETQRHLMAFPCSQGFVWCVAREAEGTRCLLVSRPAVPTA